MEERYEICPTDEIPPGERKIVEIEDKSIGIFNLEGEFHALRNVCPHQMAPLCLGEVTGTTAASKPGEYKWIKDGEILRCPWHGWEFEIATGESIFNPHKMRTQTFDVAVEYRTEEERTYGTELKGEEPPVDTYSVEVEEEIVVLYM